MDADVCRWALEFLLRTSVPDSLIKKIIAVIPVSNSDLRLKKTLLLRTIQAEVSKGLVTETILEILEVIEEMDRIDGVSITDTMKAAYCAVAVECTVKHLAAFADDSGKYFGAVMRIWRVRVGNMETSPEGSHLLSDELKEWKDDIEAALWDAEVGNRLPKMNAGKDALNRVRDYLVEAWKIMGPCFLELAAKLTNVTDLQSSGRNSVHDEHSEVAVDRADACDDVGTSGRLAEPVDEGEGRTVSSPSTSQDSGDRYRNGWAIVAVPVSMIDPQGTGQNPVDEHEGPKAEISDDESQELGAFGSTAQGDKGIPKRNLVLRRKHTTCSRHYRGVKVTSTEEVGTNGSCSKYDSLPSPEVKRVQEALKSSSLELKALVEDPLPHALGLSEIVRSELERKDMNHEPTLENQSRNADAPNTHAEPIKTNDANPGNQSSVHQSNVQRPNLMQRNSTARTYEWDDSIDDSSEGTANHSSRFNLPSPRYYNVSPLKKYESPRFPKRRKRWSVLEEDTLRAGVQKFGKGNWKDILNCFHDIFDERTEVDLKDKWRNMTR
ncbi:Telomeric repeat-binding factor like [Quillaja saponaria]|uniref:Telomeric repeat-binding factor like n=1 Tax=Quillaja saponaria TaxID=32244 RepID=A0AAD7LM94_QUISA|nr:Telomeric repeat-binding factor like [Quillaja saponaria]KAJ7959927.1 Telomeric repeat-binding factor like [Quillaja saponaria]